MEESKQQITECEALERARLEMRQKVAADMKAAAIADLMAEARTATTGQIQIVVAFLKKMQQIRGDK